MVAQRIDALNSFMRKRGLPKELQMRLRELSMFMEIR